MHIYVPFNQCWIKVAWGP